jgi:hypothetical protein
VRRSVLRCPSLFSPPLSKKISGNFYDFRIVAGDKMADNICSPTVLYELGGVCVENIMMPLLNRRGIKEMVTSDRLV